MRLASLFAALAVAAPAAAKDQPAGRPDLVKTAAAAGSFKTLLTCLIAADLADALKGDGPFTVFAPTDDAFAKLPKGTLESLLKPENVGKLRAILQYHVVPKKARFNFDAAEAGKDYPFDTLLPGKAVTVRVADHTFTVNDAKIVTRNVTARNGSIQVIDRVLLPPDGDKAAPAGGDTIPAVAEKAGTFKTLLAALTVAELADVLAGDGPFTVFAPTDEAFKKLGDKAVADLLKPANRKKLVAVLKYHVVAGAVSAKAAVVAGSAKTLEGSAVTAKIVDGRLTINESGVVKSDVAAANGVIHVIDRVLLPPR